MLYNCNVVAGCHNGVSKPLNVAFDFLLDEKSPTKLVGGLVEYIEYTALFYIIVSNLQPP